MRPLARIPLMLEYFSNPKIKKAFIKEQYGWTSENSVGIKEIIYDRFKEV